MYTFRNDHFNRVTVVHLQVPQVKQKETVCKKSLKSFILC